MFAIDMFCQTNTMRGYLKTRAQTMTPPLKNMIRIDGRKIYILPHYTVQQLASNVDFTRDMDCPRYDTCLEEVQLKIKPYGQTYSCKFCKYAKTKNLRNFKQFLRELDYEYRRMADQKCAPMQDVSRKVIHFRLCKASEAGLHIT